MDIKISSTLYAKKIKQELILKNQIVYDGGLGENPLPAPQTLLPYPGRPPPHQADHDRIPPHPPHLHTPGRPRQSGEPNRGHLSCDPGEESSFPAPPHGTANLQPVQVAAPQRFLVLDR